MKAVFINHCHPDVAHVCGLRAGRLASAMAERGHQIVLLTGPAPGGAAGPAIGDLPAALAAHDWRKPFLLPCAPVGGGVSARAREGALPAGFRQAAIACSYLAAGGMFPDWQAGVVPFLPVLAAAFQPDVVWGTFGNTDTWKLCQRLATASGSPWVGDFKDNWSAFVPVGLRWLIARRFTDAAAMTVLSTAHCDQADSIFPQIRKTILYSGVDTIGEGEGRAADGGDALHLTITGSIYDGGQLRALLAGISAWTRRRPEQGMVLRYAGNDGALVAAAGEAAGLAVERLGYLPQASLHALQAASAANLYLYNPRCLLHHKALELIAAGRPVIAYPGENDEVRGLAAEAGAALFACSDGAALSDALDIIADTPPPAPSRETREAFTWASRAAVLEQALGDVLGGGGAPK